MAVVTEVKGKGMNKTGILGELGESEVCSGAAWDLFQQDTLP